MKYSRSIAIAFITLILSLTFSLKACALPQIKAEDRLFQNIQLELLGEYILPNNTEFEKTIVGGLSGMTYSPKDDTYFAVSDDRSDRNPARVYQFKLKLDDQMKPQGIEFLKVITLQDEAGNPYAQGKIDAEGIAITPQGTIWVTSEGDAKQDLPPFIREFDPKTGKLLRDLFYPDHYVPKTDKEGNRQGIQNNLGFEALSLSANAARLGATEPYRLFTAAEADLTQDKPDRKQDEGAPIEGARARVMHYYVEQNRVDLVGEYLYQLESRPMGSEKYGLPELLSIDGAGRFLSLERTVGITGFKIKVFQFVFAGAKDTSKLPSVKLLPEVVKPVQKELLLDLNTIEDLTLDNLEGMTLGPRLPDGTQSLIMVSDNNFNKLQKTQFLVFRIKNFKP